MFDFKSLSLGKKSNNKADRNFNDPILKEMMSIDILCQ